MIQEHSGRGKGMCFPSTAENSLFMYCLLIFTAYLGCPTLNRLGNEYWNYNNTIKTVNMKGFLSSSSSSWSQGLLILPRKLRFHLFSLCLTHQSASVVPVILLSPRGRPVGGPFCDPVKFPIKMVLIKLLVVARFRTAELEGAGASDGNSPHLIAATGLEREPADQQPSILTSCCI